MSTSRLNTVSWSPLSFYQPGLAIGSQLSRTWQYVARRKAEKPPCCGYYTVCAAALYTPPPSHRRGFTGQRLRCTQPCSSMRRISEGIRPAATCTVCSGEATDKG